MIVVGTVDVVVVKVDVDEGRGLLVGSAWISVGGVTAHLFVRAGVVDVHVVRLLAFRHGKGKIGTESGATSIPLLTYCDSRVRGEGVAVNTSGTHPPPSSPSHTMATTTTTVVEEGKLLSESLATVKIQVGQMKRHLVRCASVILPVAGRHGNERRCPCADGVSLG